jgi:hypothetical protein
MIILCYNVQGEDVIEYTYDNWHFLQYNMQEANVLEHTYAKCHIECLLCNLKVSLFSLFHTRVSLV